MKGARHLLAPNSRAGYRWHSGLVSWPWGGVSPMLSESFLPFFEWCGNTWLGSTVRDTVWAFPVIETFHLLALAVLLGTVLIVNLRVLGLGARFGGISPMARELEPWLLTSLTVGLVSGVLLFVSEPMKCYE